METVALREELGSRVTTMKVGGPVRIATVTKYQDIQQIVATLPKPLFPLGGGSNLILPDNGFIGTLLKVQNTDSEVLTDTPGEITQRAEGRYQREQHAKYLQLSEPAIDESAGEPVLIRFGAGLAWGAAVHASLRAGLVGLQYFARIPCTVGGALVNNIHAGSRLFDRYVHSATIFDTETETFFDLHHDDLEFGYDTSIVHVHRSYIVCAVVCRLYRVVPELVAEAQQQYISWTAEKARVQPAGPNSGSTFQNIPAERVAAEQLPHTSAGWYVEHAGLLGDSEGGMQVYQTHGNFIINTGTGTQRDWIALVTRIRETVHAKYGVWLQPEVECINAQGNRLYWQDSEAVWH